MARIALYCQPGARISEVNGLHGDRIRIRLAARAVEGEANRALIDFLSTRFRVRRQDIQIVSGEHARFKIVECCNRTEDEMRTALTGQSSPASPSGSVHHD